LSIDVNRRSVNQFLKVFHSSAGSFQSAAGVQNSEN